MQRTHLLYWAKEQVTTAILVGLRLCIAGLSDIKQNKWII